MEGILGNERDVPAAHPSRIHAIEKVAPAEPDAAGDHLHAVGEQADQRLGGHGLAAARFADEADDLAGIHVGATRRGQWWPAAGGGAGAR